MAPDPMNALIVFGMIMITAMVNYMLFKLVKADVEKGQIEEISFLVIISFLLWLLTACYGSMILL